MGVINAGFWFKKRVFLTGHTGFKGSWLSLWLQSMGAEVFGYALHPPTNPSLFDQANVAQGMSSLVGDIRDYSSLHTALKQSRAEIVIHMAAQPLVRYSYEQPVETFATNVMGTVHLLEAIRQLGTVRAVVNVTTDKCYENKEWVWGYRETEAMGGYDPYSSSKGCSELLTSAYRRSYFKKTDIYLASGRAGNVIGGGDWAQDRLVPDILRALEKRTPVVIRHPNSIRPWQHVLEPLSGYLLLAERLYTEGQTYAEAWNFGPRDEDTRPVKWIVERLCEEWGNDASWILEQQNQAHEANVLKLDISKAREQLNWSPRWSLENSLSKIVSWHRAWLEGQDVKAVCLEQISSFNFL